MSLTVTHLGYDPEFVQYQSAWDLQRALHARVTRDPSEATLLLLEHTPTYTAGRRTTAADRPTDGTPVVDVDRGGLITWHGPGQLVAYPIARLADPMAIKDYVFRLEEAILDTLEHFGVSASRVEGRAGVWVLTPGQQDQKIAAIGIHVEHGVTMHGLALNVSNSLEPYRVIIPCGISDAGVTTLQAETGKELTPQSVAPVLEEALLRRLAPALDTSPATPADTTPAATLPTTAPHPEGAIAR